MQCLPMRKPAFPKKGIKVETMMEWIKDIDIKAPDKNIFTNIKRGWDKIAKPLDSMGRFEEIYAGIGAIQGSEKPEIGPSAVIVMCADNGIVSEGVSQSDKSVTLACAKNIAKGRTVLGAMARSTGTKIIAVDIGIDSEETIFGAENLKVARGTKDFLKEPAMTEEETFAAIKTGIELVKKYEGQGIRIFAAGEMGIGNTTTSACIISAMLGTDPSYTVGYGAGLSDKGLQRKEEVVREALKKYKSEKKESERVLNILSNVGGLDIAGMAGVFIGGAICKVPVIADGIISMTAALVAECICPGTKDYVIASIRSKEQAYDLVAKALGKTPVIDAGMAVGEGTGALMMLSLLKITDRVYKESGAFEGSGVEQYEHLH